MVVSGHFSHQSAHAANVYEGIETQTGLWAGAGGFDLQVAGHTDLKGAAIVASDEAIHNNRTRLVTHAKANRSSLGNPPQNQRDQK